MSKQIIQQHERHILGFFRLQSLAIFLTLVFLTLSMGIPVTGLAGNLNLANDALEVVIDVEPNVMILADDSASMDFGVLTSEDQGWMFMDGDTSWPYAYTHPAPSATGNAPALNIINYFNFAQGWTPDLLEVSWSNLPSEDYLRDTVGMAAPYGGVWRGRNSDYNKVYYDPDTTYSPWTGVDSSGVAFANASPTAARYNPYNSADGTLNLTTTLSDYFTGCPFTGPYATICNTAAQLTTAKVIVIATGLPLNTVSPYYTYTNTLNGTTYSTYVVLADGFYPARYYAWADANVTTPANAGNGDVDADDVHTLVEIVSTTPTYSRTAESSGGRSDCTDNGDGTATCSYAQEIQNFANWFSYYRKRDLLAKAAIGAGVESAESSRIGFATINSRIMNAVEGSTNNIEVASMNISPESGNKKLLLDKVYSAYPYGATPLRQALVDTGEYFSCNKNNIFDLAADSSPGNSGCPIEASPAGQCQQNYTILMTDGYWDNYYGDTAHPGTTVKTSVTPVQFITTGGLSSVGNTDEESSNGYDGGAFADTYSDTLADVAMHYYETDLQTGLADEVPTTTTDISYYRGATDPFETMHQHMTTYTAAFGVQTSLSSGPTDKDTAFAWTEPVAETNTTIDDLAHAAINSRGEYLGSAASDPTQLVTTMESIFNSVQASTGTATAVAFNTQEIEAGTMVFRASFNTKTNTGDLVAQLVNSDGTINSSIIWSAAEQLDSKIASGSDSRVIATYENNGDSTSTGIPFQWSSLTTAQQALLDAPQPTNKLDTAVYGTFGDERLGYLRGHSENEGDTYADGEFRDRSIEEGRLGDIVHSTPVFVGSPRFFGRDSGGYPQTTGNLYSEFVTTYADRTQITYVGANDGMLHALNTSDGSEIFAYVPNLLISELPELTDPDYSHRYYVDAKPSVNDAYITPSSGTNSGTLSWNSILMGGLGGGGKGYYALNITDPTALDSEIELKNNVMWEFSDLDDDDGTDGTTGDPASIQSDLGYSFSEPLITMTNADDGSGNKTWVAIFGNGYNSTSDDGNAVLYIVSLEGPSADGVWDEGTDYLKVDTGNGIIESADGTTPNGIGGIRAIDVDSNGTVDYVYAGDLQGNLYRFDLTSATVTDWTTTPTKIFKAQYKSGDVFARDIDQPITTKPLVTKHPTASGEYLVLIGTGSWMTTDDATSTDIQSIYGIWDNMETSGNELVTMTADGNQLVEQVFTNHTSTEHGFTVRSLSNNTVSWKDTGTSRVKGWYIDLDVITAGGSGVEYPGERPVRNIQIRGDIMFVNTIIPKDTNACSTGAGGYELAFNPETGGSGSTIIFDLDEDGEFTTADNIGDAGDDSDIITGMRFDTDTPTDSAFIGSRRMTQAGDDIRSVDTNTNTGDGIGRSSWREIGYE